MYLKETKGEYLCIYIPFFFSFEQLFNENKKRVMGHLYSLLEEHAFYHM